MKKLMLTLAVSVIGLLAMTTSAFACNIIFGEVEMPQSLIK